MTQSTLSTIADLARDQGVSHVLESLAAFARREKREAAKKGEVDRCFQWGDVLHLLNQAREKAEEIR